MLSFRRSIYSCSDLPLPQRDRSPFLPLFTLIPATMDVEKHENRRNMSQAGEEMKGFEVEGTIPTKYRGVSEIAK